MEYKQLFRRMNLDADVRSLQPGEYRKLFNGIPISPDYSSYTNAIHDVLASLFGNAVVTYSLPSGTNKCVGFLEDKVANRAFYYVANTTPANNSIYRYEAGAVTLVMRSALLDFVATDVIDSDIIGDILVFTNRRTDTYKIDVVKAIAGATYTPLIGEITLIKAPPKLPLTFDAYSALPNIDGFYDHTRNQNLLYGNYFQFYYRYIYEDYSYSVFSPASRTNNSWSLPNSTAVLLASVRGNITLSGSQTVDGVATSAGNRVLVLAQTDPINNGVYVAAAGAWSRAADFAAGNSYDLTYYVTGGLDYYFGTTWRVKTTNTGTLAITGTQVEGPNYFVVRRNETPPATVIKIEYAVRVNGTNELVVYKQENVASFTITHKFYNDAYIYTVADVESFKWNDSVPIASKSLRIFENRVFFLNNTEGYNDTSSGSLTVTVSEITPPTTRVFNAANSGGRFNVGIVYSDGYSRISGVCHQTKITIPDTYSIRYKISVATSGITAPSWATHFRIVCTKSLVERFFITQFTQDVFYYKKDSDGTYTYAKALSSSFEGQGMVIDIGALTKSQKGYTYSAGDRIKIYNRVFYSGSEERNEIHDVEILGQDGNFLLTKVINGLVLDATRSSNYYFKIYSPKIASAELFYETGETYAVASLAAGPYELYGDVEISKGVNYRDVSGDYSPTDPFANTYESSDVALIDVELMNAWDKNYIIWVTQAGRGVSGSESTRQLLKKSYLRWSNPYIQGGEVLNINTFDALDESSVKAENGVGVQLAEAGEVLVGIYETVTTAFYIGEGFVSTTNGNDFLAKTDSVLGDDRNYMKSAGCQDPATMVAKDGRVYFLDKRNGIIIRRSQDGLTVISDYGIRGLTETLCQAHIALATSRIIAGWDPQYNCYVISFIDTAGPSGYSLYFHEDSKSWVCLTDLRPEFFGTLAKRQLTFTGGALWQQSLESNYNNWFGVQYNRRLEFEISPMQSLVHLWDALEVDVASIYSTAGTNEDVVLLYHENGGILQTRINYLDFQLKERVYRSAFFRSLNDINFQNTTESKYKSPDQIRGQSAFMVITYNGTDKNVMKSITVFYTPSMNSNP
jgi:hypothetical protein